ncbi:hypothetical protein MPSEU_000628900 [Mayamaea pseudoterrestris]|nr:hypothetical protein MPSEU_000628900 [Mayamaea pseudoterrestris]
MLLLLQKGRSGPVKNLMKFPRLGQKIRLYRSVTLAHLLFLAMAESFTATHQVDRNKQLHNVSSRSQWLLAMQQEADGGAFDSQSQQQQSQSSTDDASSGFTLITPATTSNSMSHPVNGDSGSAPASPSVPRTPPLNRLSTLKELLRLTRPTSTPGILAFFLIGTYLAAYSKTSTSKMQYWNILLTTPSLWATLAALIFVSAGSMVVNDLEDVRLGRDATLQQGYNPYLDTKLLVNGSLSMIAAQRFLFGLYLTTAVTATLVPGHWTRLSILSGVVLTHLYTEYLKPITWVKNLVCALVIGMGPFTSGLAMWELLQQGGLSAARRSVHYTPSILKFLSTHWKLLRVSAVVFCGVFSREVLMDCNDVLSDRRANVRTIPVKHGRKFASRVALTWGSFMAVLVMAGPVREIVKEMSATTLSSNWTMPTMVLQKIAPATVRRLALATTTSILFLRRNWQVVLTDGRDTQAINTAVNEALLTVLVGLASFV